MAASECCPLNPKPVHQQEMLVHALLVLKWYDISERSIIRVACNTCDQLSQEALETSFKQSAWSISCS